MYAVLDWAGSILMTDFKTFDDAEKWLLEILGEYYDVDRWEYEIVYFKETTE